MFDTVKVQCPKCENWESFQSKSGDCTLATYTLNNCPADVLFGINAYGPEKCSKCGTKFCVDFTIKPTVVLEAKSVEWKEDADASK